MTAALFEMTPTVRTRSAVRRMDRRSRGRADLRVVTIERDTRSVPRSAVAVAGERPAGERSADSDLTPVADRPVSPMALGLFADARRELERAQDATGLAERYASAHLAALRAAAAMLATRARPNTRGRRSAWDLLARVAPEFAEWAAFFAAGSAKRQAAQAGISRMLTVREVDDMVRQSAEFVSLVRRALGQ